MKIRINDLARELEVKSKQILDVLIKVGVTEKKTHSSSVEEDEAEKVRKYFHESSTTPGSRHRTGGEEFRPKIDLSKISKPGDALKAILARREQSAEAVAPARPVAPPPPAPPKAIVNKPAAPKPAAPPVVERVPRMVTPESVAQRSQVSTVEMPKAPAAAAPHAPVETAAPPKAVVPPPAGFSSCSCRTPETVEVEAPAAKAPVAEEAVSAPVANAAAADPVAASDEGAPAATAIPATHAASTTAPCRGRQGCRPQGRHSLAPRVQRRLVIRLLLRLAG